MVLKDWHGVDFEVGNNVSEERPDSIFRAEDGACVFSESLAPHDVTSQKATMGSIMVIV
jgi:hypothetical protein